MTAILNTCEVCQQINLNVLVFVLVHSSCFLFKYDYYICFKICVI